MFMLAPTHESRYFLPLSVPIGILCGLTADRLTGVDRVKVRGVLGVSVGVAVVIAVATVLLAVGFPSPPIPQAHRLLLVVAGVVGGGASVYLLRRRGAHRLVFVLGIASLCAILIQVLGTEPYRASSRDSSAQALLLAQHLPAGERVWVLGPADEAGKHASLFFYLDRPIRAFRSASELPRAGAHCVLTGGGLGELEKSSGFGFREIARAEHVWFSYRLGICSETG